MTNTACTVLFAAATIAASAGAAKAQERMKAEIPFAFHASHATLPSGTYHVDRVLTAAGTVTYKITDTGGKAVLVVSSYRLENPGRRDAGSQLVFECSSDGCYLTQVWGDGASGSGFSAVKSARSRESRQVAVALSGSRAD